LSDEVELSAIWADGVELVWEFESSASSFSWREAIWAESDELLRFSICSVRPAIWAEVEA